MDHNKISNEPDDTRPARFGAANGAPECLRVLDGPQPHIKSTYRRLALVSREEDVATLDAGDEDTLIVSCNWLIWQKLAGAGRHCVYFELGLLDFEPNDMLIREINLRANAWIPKDGGDPTCFRNISLARLFASEVSMFLRNYYRLNTSLRSLCDRFRPQEIWFFDYIYDISVISAPLRKRIAASIATELGIGFADKTGGVYATGHEIGETVYAHSKRSAIKTALVSLYAGALENATRLRTLFAKRDRRVLCLMNANVAEPLVRNFSGELTPVFIGRTIPRRADMIWTCIRKGIRLTRNDAPELSKTDDTRLEDIERNLAAALDAPAEHDVTFMREYIRDEVLKPGRFRKMAREVLAAERLLDRIRPQRVVVDGVRNAPLRVVIEIARNRGIPVDYTWHSPHTPLRQKYEALSGAEDFERCVSRVLSWGQVNDIWLDWVDAPADRAQVGSPLMSKYTDVDWPAPAKNTAPEDTNVLLLQYTFNLADFAGLNANLYEAFVRLARDLKERGYKNLRYKLHPGRGRWKKSYFEEIAAHFRLDCPILQSEPYKDCLAWSDIVIGSTLSGALFETLAAKRPYVAMLLKPHSIDPSCYGDFPTYGTLEEIPAALHRDIENVSQRLLEDMYSPGRFPRPAKRLWEILENDFTGRDN